MERNIVTERIPARIDDGWGRHWPLEQNQQLNIFDNVRHEVKSNNVPGYSTGIASMFTCDTLID